MLPHYAVDESQRGSDADTIVLGNPLGCTLDIWDQHIGDLTEKFRVVRFDLRGHGGSIQKTGNWTIADLASDVLAVLDELGIDSAHYAGMSLGGALGMHVAIHQPHRIKKLALICTAAQIATPEYWYAQAQTVRNHGLAETAERSMKYWFSESFMLTHATRVAQAQNMLANIDPPGYAACCEAIAQLDLRPDLPRIDAPTLVAIASADRVTTLSDAETLLARIGNSEMEVISGAAHLANVERPEAVTDLLLYHFLS
ncbi:alpha/beta fold hydrolase [Natronoglycomyces albus]|uniref:Alpha/beta fold hydrolase n=1 Tax=Natronoglycomyces albus TaxID=2811108 RepID=A0A895XP70_9ACTN|nr:alpha/beta fold hydrolase [Natronoglycomyces albus]QSB04875.1 alpha/beta fold hydrolase [Natronoglycomyces albus]